MPLNASAHKRYRMVDQPDTYIERCAYYESGCVRCYIVEQGRRRPFPARTCEDYLARGLIVQG